jgi:hypothetical protein
VISEDTNDREEVVSTIRRRTSDTHPDGAHGSNSLSRFTVPTPSLYWFIEFFDGKYKTTQAARTALAASLFQPVSDKFSPYIHILLLPIHGRSAALSA